MDSMFYRKLSKGFNPRALLKKMLRNKQATFVALFGLMVAGFIVFGNHGILQRIHLSQQKSEMERKIREADAETKALQAQSKALDSDKKAVEKVARERYGMARQGEKVYKVDKEEH